MKKAFTRQYGWKFFQGRKPFKFTLDDILAKLDGMIARNERYIINLKK